MRIGILGAGSFGTALGIYAVHAGFEVRLWARDPAVAEELGRERCNRRYLPDVELPAGLHPSSRLADLVDSDYVIAAVPSHGFREVVRSFLSLCPPQRPVVLISATKGVEAEHLARMSQVCFEEAVSADRDLRFAVLSGPSFAAELAAGVPTAAVIASEDTTLAREVQEYFSTRVLRLYTSADVAGVELGGTAKNVIAIAAGVLTGLGFGQNTLAALITRGLHEITRLALAYGGQPRTLYGLAGLGDLVLTCTGGLSRNRQAGLALAAGRSLDELERDTGMIAEGVRNSRAIVRLAERRGVELPIAQQMAAVIYDRKQPRQALEELMLRELKSEAEL
ncbi:MAG TPA: NAD(P)H-dependent glycerol-3-phosphate dehydrogenase [Thermoanaerobaculia bacterium]|nr:NAD(P)H-dependent glycerol-3-phosphate dehydrogenase [Thermoanaerobaculia bacterium]